MVMEGGNSLHGTTPQAANPADGPDASRVAREFVRQYYTILHESPLHLHRFYNDESEFMHGGIDTQPMTVRGQQDIHQAIVALNFRQCYAKILYVDAQESENKMVVVQVAGQLTNQGGPTRHFMQTFVLVPLSARKYYVRNDIFRYQDQVFQEDEEVDEVSNKAENQDQVVSETAHFNGDHATVNGTDSNQSSDKDSNQWDNSMAQTTPNQPAAPAQQQQQQQPTSQPQPASHSTAAAAAAPTATGTPAQEARTPASNAPRSWSQMVQVKKVSSETAATPAAAQPAFGPPAPGFGGPSAGQGLPQRNPQQQRGPGALRSNGTNNGPASKTPRESLSSREEDAIGKPEKPFVPDNQQLFVGNIPTHVSEKTLIDLFSRFGKVSEFRLTPHKGAGGSAGNKMYPNFGFVVFESPEVAQKALAEVKNGSVTWEIEEGKPLRLNVEEKKMRSVGIPKGPRGPNNGPRGDRRPMTNGGGGGGGGRRGGDFNNGRVPRSGGPPRGDRPPPQPQTIQQH